MLVTQSCPTLCDPMDCSPPGSSVHRILQGRIMECVAIPFSKGSSRPRDQTQIFYQQGSPVILWCKNGVLYTHTHTHTHTHMYVYICMCMYIWCLSLVPGTELLGISWGWEYHLSFQWASFHSTRVYINEMTHSGGPQRASKWGWVTTKTKHSDPSHPNIWGGEGGWRLDYNNSWTKRFRQLLGWWTHW